MKQTPPPPPARPSLHLAALSVLGLACLPVPLGAQDLSPRAYVITPVRANAVTVGNVFNDGELLFEGTVPITGATGRLNLPSVTASHALSFFGHGQRVRKVTPVRNDQIHARSSWLTIQPNDRR